MHQHDNACVLQLYVGIHILHRMLLMLEHAAGIMHIIADILADLRDVLSACTSES